MSVVIPCAPPQHSPSPRTVLRGPPTARRLPRPPLLSRFSGGRRAPSGDGGDEGDGGPGTGPHEILRTPAPARRELHFTHSGRRKVATTSVRGRRPSGSEVHLTDVG